MPRGPRRNLRPVAASRSQPSAVTSTSSWPTDWHASSRKIAPARRVSAPTSAAGLTTPPPVGTWVRATSATSSSRARSRASRSIWPCSSSSMTCERRAGPLARLQERDRVADVLGARGEDALAGLQRDRGERDVPRDRRALHQGDLVAVGADERRDRVVHGLDPLGRLRLGLVRADLRLAPQVRDDRVGDHLRTQRAAGVVQVGDVLDAGGVSADAVQIDRHAGSLGGADQRLCSGRTDATGRPRRGPTGPTGGGCGRG